MTQTEALAIWMVAAVLPLVINIMTGRSTAAVGVSLALFLSWVIGIVMWMLYPLPVSLTLNPVVDLFIALWAFQSWRAFPVAWKLALLPLLGAQLCLHTDFWTAYAWGHLPENGATFYTRANSLLFAIELCVVGGVGVSRVAGATLGWMLDRLRGGHHARSVP